MSDDDPLDLATARLAVNRLSGINTDLRESSALAEERLAAVESIAQRLLGAAGDLDADTDYVTVPVDVVRALRRLLDDMVVDDAAEEAAGDLEEDWVWRG